MTQVTDQLWALTGIPTTIFVIGHIVGTVLLGIIIFQAKLAPPWAAAMLTASQPLHFIAILTGLPCLDMTAWGMTAMGMVFLAARVLRTPNEQWDLPTLRPHYGLSTQPSRFGQYQD